MIDNIFDDMITNDFVHMDKVDKDFTSDPKTESLMAEIEASFKEFDEILKSNTIQIEKFLTIEEHQQLQEALNDLNTSVSEYKEILKRFSLFYTFDIEPQLKRNGEEIFNKILANDVLLQLKFNNAPNQEAFKQRYIESNELNRMAKVEEKLQQIKDRFQQLIGGELLPESKYEITTHIVDFKNTEFTKFLDSIDEFSTKYNEFSWAIGVGRNETFNSIWKGMIWTKSGPTPAGRDFLKTKLSQKDTKYYNIVDTINIVFTT